MTDIDHRRRRLLRGLGASAALTGLGPALWLTGCDGQAPTADGSAKDATQEVFDVDLRLRAHPDTVSAIR